ncbi:MAG: 2-oxoacid:acceptor oxidoreductase family protein [Candidatus Heimdallarchaeaceae archaeon]
MVSDSKTVNIALLGLGGQGIITLAKLLANASIALNKEVCYNEIHGLSQRGGSVQSFVRLNESHTPLFASNDVDFVVGLEKLETLRYLYTIKNYKTIVVMLDYYERRNTAYFGLEVFPSEEEIDKEIRKRAKKLYLIDRDSFKKQFKGNFVPYNVGMFSAITTFDMIGIPQDVAEKTVSKLLGRNMLLSRINNKAFKEGKKWLKEVNLTK